MTGAPMQETGEPLDFAIAGNGFFAVQSPQGVRYTRDGQFRASAQGVLTDSGGNAVLDQGGAQIKVSAAGRCPRAPSASSKSRRAVKQGDNMFAGTAGGKGTGSVRAGALEGSGVDAAKVMVEMINSLRDFQSGQQAIQAIAQTLQSASTQVASINPTA